MDGTSLFFMFVAGYHFRVFSLPPLFVAFVAGFLFIPFPPLFVMFVALTLGM